MIDIDMDLVRVRADQVLQRFSDEPGKCGKIDILFEPGTYDGNGKALARPYRQVNLVGHPLPERPVIFRNFKIHDALFVNCSLQNNAGKLSRHLGHHLRIFNAVVVENTLSNCSLIGLDDFIKSYEQQRAGTIDGKSTTKFLKAYLSTLRRFATLLPDHRKDVLPEYIWRRFKISVVMCNDGIAIWFRKAIKKKKDSIKLLQRNSLGNVFPRLSAEKNIFPLKGQRGILVRDLAIVTQQFADSKYKVKGTVLKLSNDLGILSVESGSDLKLENILLGNVDRYGKPRQIVLRGFWVIANDDPSLFSAEEGKEKAQAEFLRRLISSGPIRGNRMKRYSEADLAREIDEVKSSYVSLVSRENAEESELQEFLEEHPFILSPTYLDVCSRSLDVIPQVRMASGKRIVDFLLLFEPDPKEARRLATVVEIKKPSHKLFVRKGECSKDLQEGLQQVEQVFTIVDSGTHEASKLGLRKSDKITGMVLIGRRADMEKKELSYLEKLNRARTRTEVVTFDALLENIETVRGFYGLKGRQPVVVVGQEGTCDEDFTGKTGAAIQSAIDYLEKRMKGGQ